jgi:hypothetical protein
MKPKVLVILILFLSNKSLLAQDTLQKKHIIFHAEVKTMQLGQFKGYFATMNDSAIFLGKKPISFSLRNTNDSSWQKFDYQILQQIQIQRKSSAGKGALYGALGIFAVVEIYILISSGQQTVYNLNTLQRTVIIAIPASLLGGIVGAAIGAAIHHTYVIGGIKEKLHEMKNDMINKLY